MVRWMANICFLGALITFGLGTFGLFKLPDPYTRLHSAGMSDTLGVGLTGLGLMLLSPDWFLRIKLAVLLLLFWTISPVMTHLTAKAGLIRGIKPVKGTKIRKEADI